MKKFAARVIAPVVAAVLGSPAFAADPVPAKARVDINTATKAELQEKLGIGDAEANKIIEARPYQAKDELKTREILSADDFAKIAKLIESVC